MDRKTIKARVERDLESCRAIAPDGAEFREPHLKLYTAQEMAALITEVEKSEADRDRLASGLRAIAHEDWPISVDMDVLREMAREALRDPDAEEKSP